LNLKETNIYLLTFAYPRPMSRQSARAIEQKNKRGSLDKFLFKTPGEERLPMKHRPGTAVITAAELKNIRN